MKTIRIQYHHEMDGWWAESPDIGGYVVAGDSLAEVRSLVKEGLPFYFENEQIDILESTSTGTVFVVEIDENSSSVAQSSTGVSVTETVHQQFSAFMPQGFVSPVRSSNGSDATVEEHLELAGWQ